jgi:hypothetical protein
MVETSSRYLGWTPILRSIEKGESLLCLGIASALFSRDLFGCFPSRIYSNQPSVSLEVSDYIRFLQTLLESNLLFSMSHDDGALTQLRGALDRDRVPSGSYVGPTSFVDKPKLIGNLNEITFHHRKFHVMGPEPCSSRYLGVWKPRLEEGLILNQGIC